ncbi:uncharacterized protein LOC129751978 [Uranotaenia lowii]|uniref:uncharacterized protein LOC129751978 n=1 Tax=Uranotaenia lowii TaxID=190385 RepID=UPI0024797AFE|nr:uncharacterized protein LOC129751978 [Uranotaenia lowii]
MATAGNDAPTPVTIPEEEFNCVACDRPDSVANLVQCDVCDDWWHQTCAGVTGSIENRPWTCRKCLPAISVRSGATSSGTRSKRIQLQLQHLAENRELEQRALDIRLEAIQAEKNLVDTRYKLLQSTISEEDESSVRSRLSRRISRQITAEWLDQISSTENSPDGPILPSPEIASVFQGLSSTEVPRKEFNWKGKLTPRNSFDTNKPKDCAEKISTPNLENVLQSNPAPKQQPAPVGGAIKKQKPVAAESDAQQRSTRIPEAEECGSSNSKPDVEVLCQLLTECLALNQRPKQDHVLESARQNSPTPIPTTTTDNPENPANRENKPHPSSLVGAFLPLLPPLPEKTGKTTPNKCLPAEQLYEPHESLIKQLGSCPNEYINFAQVMADYTPTPSQLAARQVMARDLPTFTGNPADWPVFISTFTTTTLACGYNQAENLLRLQRCLKGDALESVRSRILIPNSVPGIIDTLRSHYGRPEQLIKVLLNKIKTIPAPKAEKLETLIDYGLAVQSFCDTLEAANQTAHFFNPSLLAELVDRLPISYQMQWACYSEMIGEVNLKQFGEFMSALMKSARLVTSYVGTSNRTEERGKPKRGVLHAHADYTGDETRERTCIVCGHNHRLNECEQFKSLNVDERWQVVEREGLCRNCLNFHGHRSCRVSGKCNVNGCHVRHHPLLHFVRSQQAQPSSRFPTNQRSKPTVRGPPVYENHVHRSVSQLCLFRIVPIVVHGSGNRKIQTFAFLDEGSSLTLVEEALVGELGLQGERQTLCLRWTGNVMRTERDSKVVELSVSGIDRPRFKLRDTRTVKALSLPHQSMNYRALSSSFSHLRGLPITSYQEAVPRVLIGLNNLRLTVPLSIKEGRPQEPVATKTRLGWCIYGGTTEDRSKLSVNIHSNDCSCDNTLHTAVRDYFALEDVGVAGRIVLESKSDKRAKQILEETTIRKGDRFETGLLWRFDHFEFPDSRPMALKRHECLERKLKRNPEMLECVTKQIEEYQVKGYARRATETELQKEDCRKVWYLPLGVVVNPKKPNKVRMIWDAAATVNGVSLNAMLLKGPDQLAKLPWVLFRFRQFSVAVSGDIAEMFHQIRIRPEDQHAQRFLWRTDPFKEPEVFVMQVATFGATCSPASALFVKRKNALDYENVYPRAVEEIFDCHYMDDYLSSFGTERETEEIAKEVKTVHAQGGFNIRGWRSNSSKVLEGLGEPISADPRSLNLEHTNIERVLGMHWLPKDDFLAFSTSFQPQLCDLIASKQRPTKRQVLRILMSVFDPLGLLAAFVIQGKVLLQDIWRAGTQWDEEISDRTNEKWVKWIEQFPMVADVRVPRCYFPSANKSSYRQLELHIFADASEDAYAAVAYFRIPISADGFRCALVAAKTKVAPLRHWSIPRLELQSAVLAARLETFIKEGHKVNVTRTIFWSDSSTVLAWIRSDHRRYSQFVACRVSEILSTTSIADWRWVPTKQNVADMATKQGQGDQLNTDSFWFKGPGFLLQREENWPQPRSIQPTEEEQKHCLIHESVAIPESIIDSSKFSKWERMLRTMAYVFRYVDLCEKRQPRWKGARLNQAELQSSLKRVRLNQTELQKAENYLFRTAQWSGFLEEMSTLSYHRQKSSSTHIPMEKGSKLYKLCPYMDERSVMRVDGRIGAAANVGDNVKFPVILPKTHRVTVLLIDFYHRKFKHANFETVVNELRQIVYIPQVRSRVKQVIKCCQYCRVYKSRPQVPRMAPLPAARLASYTRPFTYVGLDLFGPIFVKVGRSSAKRWIALFTCLTLRAVHVEVVFSLSTESCIMAIRRFIDRRGSPLEFYSDNGTNFRGADNVLQEQVRNIQEGLSSTFTNTTTKWIFIPPGTPHMGGAWERMVRSVKTAMESSISANRKLNDEGLWTLVIEAESIVNSRPLTYLPLEAEENEAITPNHLLLGSSNGVKQPSIEPIGEAFALKNAWNQIQHQADMFWRRWVREYMPELTRRSKWLGETRPVGVGDLVIIVDEARRNGWVRGRVNEVIPGQDGRIRKAIIQTQKGLTRQSVSKLALLDVAVGGNPGSF